MTTRIHQANIEVLRQHIGEGSDTRLHLAYLEVLRSVDADPHFINRMPQVALFGHGYGPDDDTPPTPIQTVNPFGGSNPLGE